MARIPRKSFAVNETGDVVAGAEISVTKAAGGGIAALYAAATGAETLTNPFNAGDGTILAAGEFEYFVDAGEYIEEVGVSPTSSVQRLSLLWGERVNYASRTALVSDVAAGATWPDGYKISDGVVDYKSQAGATAISDLPGLIPYDEVMPNHFEENTTPGATDMSDALAASMSYGPTTLLGQDYLVTKVSRIYSRDGASLEGVGRQNDNSTSSEYRSRILRSGGGTYDVIDLYTDEVSGEGVPLSCRNITFKNVTFDTTGAEPTGGAYVKCSDRIQNGVFDECSFDNGYAQLDLLAPLELTIKNCGFGATGRTLAAGDAVTLSPDARATDGIERKPADVHIYSNQFKETGTAQFRSFVRILAGDGVYIHDNHFQNSREDHLRIDPSDGGDPTESLASIIVTNNYFDSSNRYHVYMTGDKAKYRDLAFKGNQFRAASGVSSIVSSATIAISRVRILGNTFRDCDYSAIRCTTTPAPERWIVNDNVFSDNNVTNSSAHGDIRLNGDHLFSGNMFQGGGVSGYAINLDGSASVVSGNDLTQSDASLVILGGASASVFGNAGITNPGTVAKAGCGFNSVADLIADTSLSYAPAQYFETTVAAGDVVTALGYTYEVAASGASDQHLTTAGGVNLNVLADNGVFRFDAFGPNKDGVTDDSALLMKAINAAADSFRGRVEIGPGQYAMNVQTILVPSSVELVAVSSNGGQRGGAASVNRPVNFIANHAGPIIQIGDAAGSDNTVNVTVSGIAMEAGAGFDQAYIGYLIEDARNSHMENLLVERADKAFHFTAARQAVQYLITERLAAYQCNYGVYIDLPTALGETDPFMQACKLGLGNISASINSAVYIGGGQLSHNRLVFEGGQSGGNGEHSIHMVGDADNRSIWTLEGNGWFENNTGKNVLVESGATLYLQGDVTDSGASNQRGGYTTTGTGKIIPLGNIAFYDYVLPYAGFSTKGLRYAWSFEGDGPNFYDSIGMARAENLTGGVVTNENTRFGSAVRGDGSGGGLRVRDYGFDWTQDWTLAVLFYAETAGNCIITEVQQNNSPVSSFYINLRNGYAQVGIRTDGASVVIGSMTGHNVNPLNGPCWMVLSYDADGGSGGGGRFILRKPDGSDGVGTYDADIPPGTTPDNYLNWSLNGSIAGYESTIDEYALYDRILSADEVRGLYQSTQPLSAMVGAQQNVPRSTGTTGGASSAGAGNQYVELNIGGTVYKVLHDGTA